MVLDFLAFDFLVVVVVVASLTFSCGVAVFAWTAGITRGVANVRARSKELANFFMVKSISRVMTSNIEGEHTEHLSDVYSLRITFGLRETPVWTSSQVQFGTWRFALGKTTGFIVDAV